MKLYHGSPACFSAFRTPTGREEMDVTRGGVIYLTECKKTAQKYAGRHGYVYTVAAPSAVPYAEQRRRQNLPQKQALPARRVGRACGGLPHNGVHPSLEIGHRRGLSRREGG